ncbi:unnamed protein product, partial [Amoebophrya sp. A25]
QIIRDIEDCSQSPEEVLPLLNQLRSVKMTVDILRRTKIGVFTQKYKSHKDEGVQTTVRDLRQQWKDLIQVMSKAKEGSHHQVAISPQTSDQVTSLGSGSSSGEMFFASASASSNSSNMSFLQKQARRRRETSTGGVRDSIEDQLSMANASAASRRRGASTSGSPEPCSARGASVGGRGKRAGQHRRVREAFRDCSSQLEPGALKRGPGG